MNVYVLASEPVGLLIPGVATTGVQDVLADAAVGSAPSANTYGAGASITSKTARLLYAIRLVICMNVERSRFMDVTLPFVRLSSQLSAICGTTVINVYFWRGVPSSGGPPHIQPMLVGANCCVYSN